MANEVDSFFIVAAIDLGTSYSSYAYSFKSDYQRDPLQIYFPTETVGKYLSKKTSSVILLNPDKSFNSFGYEAEKEFIEMKENETVNEMELKKYYYVESFKMALYQETENDPVQTKIQRDMEVDDVFGKSISLMHVLKLSIWYLKDHLLKELNSRGFPTTAVDIRWVITVPAIWTDQAKQLTRECALKAGIPNKLLLLAYEPEVAALYCKQLPADQVKGTYRSLFQEGDGIMVVDLGGGTSDITVQEVTRDKMRSTLTVSGGPWGGTKVNTAFIRFLVEILGEEVINKFKWDLIEDFLDLIHEFELKKRETDFLKKGTTLKLKVPLSLRELYSEFHKKEFENTEDVSWKRDKMQINPKRFERFFLPTVTNITEHLRSLLDGDRIKVSTILMVGGFSQCNLVRDAIKQAFPRHHVVIPMDCDLSVLKGAVLYGYRPESITARYCHYSIGISLNKPYDPNQHVGAETFRSGRTLKCGNCFETFFRQGRIVEVGEKESVDVHSDHRTDDRERWRYDVKEIEVYATKNPNPKFVTEPGCKRHAMITIHPPSEGWPEIVDGKIEMEVGGTEVIVRYVDLNTHDAKVLKLDSLTCFG